MRFHSEPIEEHAEAPVADEGRFEALVAHFEGRKAGPRASAEGENACYVVSIHDTRDAAVADARLGEITGLVEAQGDRVVGSQTQLLVKPDPRTLVRSGVAERIAERARELGADMLVLDAELTPSQARNLEDATGLPICDREAVILNVFERNARTRRARIQVEIAHLEYLRPRIRGIGLNMDQQAGGVMRGRGAGETASELLARRLDGRLADLRRSLEQVERAGAAQRKHREGSARVSLVGYTNAGKTSLMNALTAAGLSVRDRPFETLDATSRCLSRHGGDVLLSDTVGFIRRLPERLFASFASTLAEVSESTLLLLVVDVSDPEAPEHLRTTEAVLDQLGAGSIDRLVVFNKADRLETPPNPEELTTLARGADHVLVSSREEAAVASLRETILERARSGHETREVFVPYARAELSQRVHADCRVLRAIVTERGTQFLIEGAPHVVDEIARACRRPR